MLWEAVNTNVERQLPELIERAKDKGSKLGFLQPAIAKVMRECYRLLAPSGMMIHIDGSD